MIKSLIAIPALSSTLLLTGCDVNAPMNFDIHDNTVNVPVGNDAIQKGIDASKPLPPVDETQPPLPESISGETIEIPIPDSIGDVPNP
jgi:hypothetical protein